MGFKVVREVGANGLSDLPHQLVWGGVGTRMDADTTTFLRRWSNMRRPDTQLSDRMAEDHSGKLAADLHIKFNVVCRIITRHVRLDLRQSITELHQPKTKETVAKVFNVVTY
jgi:hypothetical protein